ncbi:MAG: phosphotransferase, partial [Pseudomonadota bacterium]
AGDASNRRYLRLPPAQVVMDAPPDRGEDVAPFLAVTDWLRDRGFAAPEIYAADPARGFLVLEDLGDDLFARVVAANPAAETELYGAAINLLAALHTHPAPATMGEHPLQPYDAAVLLREARLALEWYAPGVGAPLGAEDLAAFDRLIAETCAPIANARDIIVLRDYHAENLLWLPAREGVAQVGLLDYQDALAGHRAYDLVSLLEDARRATSPALQEAMIARYLAASGVAESPFRAAYAILGAQRNLKIIGIFARLCLRDGKDRYPALIPRVWGHLMGDLAHPALAGLRAFVECHLPEPTPERMTRLAEAAGSHR